MPNTPYITVTDETDADGKLAEAYAQCGGSAERVGNIFKIQSLSPRAMLAHHTLYKTLMFGPSPLKRAQREMIATLVSALNDCHY
jgi:alkylhydroperoxidase family enzyme